MIRIAKLTDYPRIIKFLDQNWKKDHILVRSKELFDWQHKDIENYNFIISIHEKSLEVTSLFGFIPLNLFDRSLKSKYYYGAIWKSTKQSKPGEGLYLIKFFLKKFNPLYLGFIGISSDSIFIYKKLGLSINTLNHFYKVNKSFNDYKIIKNPKSKI